MQQKACKLFLDDGEQYSKTQQRPWLIDIPVLLQDFSGKHILHAYNAAVYMQSHQTGHAPQSHTIARRPKGLRALDS